VWLPKENEEKFYDQEAKLPFNTKTSINFRCFIARLCEKEK
jgi:hypothetical protein